MQAYLAEQTYFDKANAILGSNSEEPGGETERCLTE